MHVGRVSRLSAMSAMSAMQAMQGFDRNQFRTNALRIAPDRTLTVALTNLQTQLSASEELMMMKITQLSSELAHSKQNALLSSSAAAAAAGGSDDTGALTQLLTAQTARLDELAQDMLTNRKAAASELHLHFSVLISVNHVHVRPL